jgi:hypothetical protein
MRRALSHGDHVAVRTPLIEHHGVVVRHPTTGLLCVVNRDFRDICVGTRIEPVDSFCRRGGADPNSVYVIEDRTFSREVAETRALSRVGVPGYNPFTDNCEHEATWIVCGTRRSVQLESVAGAAGAMCGLMMGPFGARAGAEFMREMARIMGGG